MGRRIAVLGAVLVTVGVLVQVGLAQLTIWGAPGPLATLVRQAFPVIAGIAFLCATTGAILLAVSLLVGLTGQPLMADPPQALLWIGIAASVLWMGIDLLVVQNAAFHEAAHDVPLGLVVALSATASLLRVIGAAALALWLAGILTSRHPAPRGSRRNAAMAPSRPF